MKCFVGLGANLGDRARTMRLALRRLAAAPDVFVAQVSALYETPPWGKTDQPPFLNAAACLQTDLTPPELLRLCQRVEQDLGRERRETWGPRTIDIDLLCIPGVTLRDEALTLPHPYLTRRAFVLVPLADIAAAEIVGDRTVADWLTVVGDRDSIVKIAESDWPERG